MNNLFILAMILDVNRRLSFLNYGFNYRLFVNCYFPRTTVRGQLKIAVKSFLIYLNERLCPSPGGDEDSTVKM